MFEQKDKMEKMQDIQTYEVFYNLQFLTRFLIRVCTVHKNKLQLLNEILVQNVLKTKGKHEKRK